MFSEKYVSGESRPLLFKNVKILQYLDLLSLLDWVGLGGFRNMYIACIPFKLLVLQCKDLSIM